MPIAASMRASSACEFMEPTNVAAVGVGGRPGEHPHPRHPRRPHGSEVLDRPVFVERLQRALAARDGDDSEVAVLLLDVDRFRNINDTAGHPEGDELLEGITLRLHGALEAAGTLARFGGDDFAILCEGIFAEADATAIAQRLLATLNSPFAVGERRRAIVTASVGIATSSGRVRGAEQLIADADIAMYRAKELGGGRYQVFDGDLRRRVVERLTIEQELRRGLQREEFVLFFQPVVSLAERRIVAVEALMRWQHPQRGLIPPAEFASVADSTGLIVPLGRAVIDEATRQIARWASDSAIDLPYVTANVSTRELCEPGFVEHIAESMARAEINPAQLGLELTDSGTAGDDAAWPAQLNRLRRLGVRLLSDDFGSGSQSLVALRRFPVEVLKVPGSLVRGIVESPSDLQVLEAIARMARAFGIEVVAKGIETPEQARCAAAVGCTLAQGYLFARPLPASAMEELLRGRGTLDRVMANMGAIAATPRGEPATGSGAQSGESPSTTTHPTRMVSLGEAAEALGVSTSTVRRWADSGRLRSARTTGGHRRFAIDEIRRLNREGDAFRRPAVRTVALPADAVSEVAALLGDPQAAVLTVAVQHTYEATGRGWFARAATGDQLTRWAGAVADAFGTGDYGSALLATRDMTRAAHGGGASLLETHSFLERCAEAVLRGLRDRQVAGDAVVSARRGFMRLSQAVLEEWPAGAA